MRLPTLIALLPLLAALAAQAATVRLMFERDDDVASNELVFRSHASLDDLANNVIAEPDRISPINIAGRFSTTGLTWDGQQFVLMFERDDDVASNELVFRTHASFDDLAGNVISGPDRISPINIAANFSTTGLTWDGQQYVLMFERDDDVASNELIFRTYASFDDLANNLPSAPDRISPINIAANFSTRGLSWDGQQYVLMFERDDDVAINELVFRTYADFDDLAGNLPSAPDRISPINIAANFSTTGLAFEWTADPPPQPVPAPASLALAVLALLAATATPVARRVSRRRGRA